MVPTLFFYQLGLVALACVFLMFCWLWPNDAASPHQPIVPTTLSRRKRSKEPQPFAGLTQRPRMQQTTRPACETNHAKMIHESCYTSTAFRKSLISYAACRR